MPAQPPELQPCMETAPGTWTASRGSSSCGHTPHQSIGSWHIVLPQNMVREWRVHLSAGSWLWTGLQQRVCGGLLFPRAKQPTHAQQTHVHCLEAAESAGKGDDQVQKLEYWKMWCSWTMTCLEVYSGRRPFEMHRVKLDSRLWLLWFQKPMMCCCSTCKLLDWVKPVQWHTQSLFTDPGHFPLAQIGVLKKQTNKQTNQPSNRFWEAAARIGVSDASYWTLFTLWSLED